MYHCVFKYNFKLDHTGIFKQIEVLCNSAPSNALLCYYTEVDAVLYKVERDVCSLTCSFLTV